jgi:hypothetical protein
MQFSRMKKRILMRRDFNVEGGDFEGKRFREILTASGCGLGGIQQQEARLTRAEAWRSH